MLGGSVNTRKEIVEVLVVASKEIGLEVNADKPMYMVMSGDQNAGRSHSMKTDNSSSLKAWNSSNYWEQPSYTKILFRKI